MDMVARILDKLRQSPFSVEELAFDLKRKPYEVRLLVNALLRNGSIVKLDTDRDGGPFYVSFRWASVKFIEKNCTRTPKAHRHARDAGGLVGD
jgi:predicted transcriptional regulator